MSSQRFPAHRFAHLRWRTQVALLATGAAVAGGASGVGIPALAGDPACSDPARAGSTVLVDGQVVTCETAPAATERVAPAETQEPAPQEPAAQPAAPEPAPEPDPVPQEPAPQDPAPEPDPVPQDPAPEDPAVPEDPAPEDPAVPQDPAPEEPAVPQDPAPEDAAVPQDPAAPQDPAVPQEPATPQEPAAEPTTTPAPPADAAPARELPQAPAPTRPPAREQTDRADPQLVIEEHEHDEVARRDAGRDVLPTADERRAAEIYASLPAEWTSLSPIILPSGSIGDFPIPPVLLPIYQAAAAEYGVPWEVLASINEIETNFGRNATVSSAGALGWMQFMPSSWEEWGVDGDGDRRRDPRNPVDAIFAAANYLADHDAQENLPRAVFAYNHADWYVNRVIERAREFAGLNQTMVAALTERALREDADRYRAPGDPFSGEGAIEPSPGQALLLPEEELARIVLDDPDIAVYPGGRTDIEEGRIDRRVLAALVFLERSGMPPTVSSMFSGHSRYTTSGNVSAHSYGHAVDIAAVNGTSILGHQGAGSITEKALRALTDLQGYLRANQVISLMTIAGRDNTIAMGDHHDHIHLGFPRVPTVRDTDRPEDVDRIVERFLEHRDTESATADGRPAGDRSSRGSASGARPFGGPSQR